MSAGNVSTFESANATAPDGWNYLASFRVTFGIIQFTLNVSMLLSILILRALRNAFTVYVAALFTANLIYVNVEYPLDVIQIVYFEFSVSSFLCTFHLYMVYVFAVVRLHMHVLITVNRIWAIQFPVHYRNVHSTKIAYFLCFGTVLYIHILIIPLLTIDMLYYRLPGLTSDCGLASDRSQLFFIYELVVQFITDDLLIVVIIGAYPFLYYKRMRANRHREGNPSEKASGSRPFLLLTLLTLGIVVTSAPASLYVTMMYFVTDYEQYSGFQKAALVLSSLLPVIDPIVFGLSLGRVNNFVGNVMKGAKRNRLDLPVADLSLASRTASRM